MERGIVEISAEELDKLEKAAHHVYPCFVPVHQDKIYGLIALARRGLEAQQWRETLRNFLWDANHADACALHDGQECSCGLFRLIQVFDPTPPQPSEAREDVSIRDVPLAESPPSGVQGSRVAGDKPSSADDLRPQDRMVDVASPESKPSPTADDVAGQIRWLEDNSLPDQGGARSPNARRYLEIATALRSLEAEKDKKDKQAKRNFAQLQASEAAREADLRSLQAENERLKASACTEKVDEVLDRLAARFAVAARANWNEYTLEQAQKDIKQEALDAFCTLALPYKNAQSELRASQSALSEKENEIERLRHALKIIRDSSDATKSICSFASTALMSRG